MILHSTKMKSNFIGHKGTRFLTIVFAIHLCLCHNRIIYAACMVLDGAPQVHKTDAAAHTHTIMEQHIFMLSSLPPLTEEHESIVKYIMLVTVTAIIMITTIEILIYIWERCRYSSSSRQTHIPQCQVP